MESRTGYKPAGGVERVVLHPASSAAEVSFAGGCCRCTFADGGVEVPLCDDRSRFEEELLCQSPPPSVRHRLTLVAERARAAAWADADFIARAVHEGVVAEIVLSDSRTLVCGVSEHLGAEQPMRPVALLSDSGVRLSQGPTLTLTLESEDTAFAMPKTNL